MKISPLFLIAGAVVTGVAISLPSETDVPLNQYHCITNQPGKFPVKILASDTGAVFREGGVKRFEIDEQAKTCAYTDKSGDTMIFHMK